MKRSSRGWMLLPALIVIIAVVTVVLSNYQKEAGITDASKGGPDAVWRTLTARDLALGQTEAEYATFADALLVATVSQRSLPVINAADTRLSHILADALDCLYAAREAWQAEIDSAWDQSLQGTAAYWRAAHPTLELPSGDTLTATMVRQLSSEQAAKFLERAVDFVN